MAESRDYRELLQLLNEFEVDYPIVGGFAVMKYGEPRYTKDLDVWISRKRTSRSASPGWSGCCESRSGSIDRMRGESFSKT